MTTLCSALAAAMPPLTPRQLITAAFSASPPSRISSQPMILRPLEVTNLSIRLMNQLWSSWASLSPSAFMRAWHNGQRAQ